MFVLFLRIHMDMGSEEYLAVVHDPAVRHGEEFRDFRKAGSVITPIGRLREQAIDFCFPAIPFHFIILYSYRQSLVLSEISNVPESTTTIKSPASIPFGAL